MNKDFLTLLSDPFEPHDIEWRVQRSGVSAKGNPWVVVIPYVTNRAIQQRLDDVFGLGGWENIYQECSSGKGYLCGIKVQVDDGKWITKWDGSEYTQIEALKGALSGSMKRAAVQLGIGRYLYNLEEKFADIVECEAPWATPDGYNFIRVKTSKGQNSPKVPCAWGTPQLPEWALPSVKPAVLKQAMTDAPDMDALHKAWETAYKYASSFKRDALMKEFTAAKDERKQAIVDELAAKAEENKHAVWSWLKQVMSDEINEADNKSVIEVALTRIDEQLSAKLKAVGLSDLYSDFSKQLIKAASERKKQLKVK